MVLYNVCFIFLSSNIISNHFIWFHFAIFYFNSYIHLPVSLFFLFFIAKFHFCHSALLYFSFLFSALSFMFLSLKFSFFLNMMRYFQITLVLSLKETIPCYLSFTQSDKHGVTHSNDLLQVTFKCPAAQHMSLNGILLVVNCKAIFRLVAMRDYLQSLLSCTSPEK